MELQDCYFKREQAILLINKLMVIYMSSILQLHLRLQQHN